MRKIVEKKKKDRTKQIVLGVVLVSVMFVSVLGYAFQGNKEEKNDTVYYNGFEFVKQNSLWFLNSGELNFYFTYNPNEVKRVYSELKPINEYSGKPLYIFSENDESSLEIYRNLFYSNRIVQRVQEACLNEEGCEENLPIKTCEDSFIIITSNNLTSITQNGSCVFIQGPKENLTQITDEFLFKILGLG